MNAPDPGDAARLCRFLYLSAAPAAANVPLAAILLFVLCLLLCALCSAAEEALLSASGSRLRKLAEGGSRRAQRVLAAAEDEAGFAAAMQSGRICFAAAGAVVLAAGCVRPLRDLRAAAMPHSLAAPLAVVLIALAALLLLLPFGVRIPRELAEEAPEEAAMRLVGPAGLVRTFLAPVTAIARALSNIAVRLAGGDPNAPEDVTEEEIREMVDAGEENGVIEETEKDMIANIMDFNDTTAGQVMTHRTDVVALEDTESPAMLVQTAIENGVSRIPVYHEDLDTVVGVCHIKDYLPYVGKALPETLRITDHMRPAYFIPESKKCSQLFTEMTERKIQFAVVVDEYGGTAGILSMEDLVESIVGNIQDEYDQEEELEARRVNENTFDVDGATPVEEIGDLTGEALPEGDYDTVAGFVVEQIGTIPKEGEHPSVTYRSLTLTVQKVEDRRIARLLIQRDPEYSPEEENGEKDRKA